MPCEISEWSPWGNCSAEAMGCGRGERTRTRTIKIFARNGGTPCPPSEHLIQKRHCELRPCGMPPKKFVQQKFAYFQRENLVV